MSDLPDWRAVPLPWQTQIWERAGSWLQSGRLPHALMISGVAGSGKQVFAQALAALTLCRQPANGRACGVCSSCRQIAAGAHPDYHWVTIVEDKTVISVDQIRELTQALVLTSQYGKGKVAVLYPAEDMNLNAANSLLKTLEEPTPDTLLLLVTANPSRLPATIRSRCQVLPLGVPAVAAAVGWLQAQEPRSDWTALLGIAGGGPLLALQFAQTEFVQQRLNFYQMLMELRTGRRNPLACAAEVGREPLRLVLRLLQTWIMDLVTLMTVADVSSPLIINQDARVLLQTALQGLHLRQLHAYLDHVRQAMALAATPVNSQLLLENLFIEWAGELQTLETAPFAAGGG